MEGYIKLKQFKEVEKILEKENFLTGDIGKYLKIERECFDDLVIEKIGTDEYSIAYYYRHPSGDSLREPEITFLIKKYENKKTFIPLSYTLDSNGIYWCIKFSVIEHDNKPKINEITGDLRTFAAVWDNLKEFNLLFKTLNLKDYKVSRDI